MSSWICINREVVVTLRADHSPNHLREEVERCFLELRDQIFRYLRAQGCEHSMAEEITQEVFLRFYRALKTGPRVNDPRAWVFRVARNLYIDSRREHQRYRVACQDETSLRSDTRPNPEQQVLQQERAKRIEQEVLRLPQLQRECMHLRAQGLRYREIAMTLEITLSAAVECIRAAVKRLGSIVSE